MLGDQPAARPATVGGTPPNAPTDVRSPSSPTRQPNSCRASASMAYRYRPSREMASSRTPSRLRGSRPPPPRAEHAAVAGDRVARHRAVAEVRHVDEPTVVGHRGPAHLAAAVAHRCAHRPELIGPVGDVRRGRRHPDRSAEGLGHDQGARPCEGKTVRRLAGRLDRRGPLRVAVVVDRVGADAVRSALGRDQRRPSSVNATCAGSASALLSGRVEPSSGVSAPSSSRKPHTLGVPLLST